MPRPEVPVARPDAVGGAHAAQFDANSMALQHCRLWLRWAAAQVEDCLARDNLASADLLRALAEALGSERSNTNTATAPACAGSAAGREMSAVVIAVQSHDRVMQGLAHVAESLRSLEAQLGDARKSDSADAWRMLRDTQFRAFSMAQERALFARMVAHEDEIGSEAELGADDAVELFTGDHGLNP